MTRKVSDAQYTWEKIGTTAADLTGYAKSVTINGTTYSASAANAGVLDLGKVVKSIINGFGNGNNGLYISENSDDPGLYYVNIAAATPTQMGTSKMFTSKLSSTSSESDATDTAVSVKSAQAMYSSLAALANSKVSVKGNAYLNLAGLAVYTSYDYNNVEVSSENIRSINDGTTVIESANIIGVKDCTLVDKTNNTNYRIDTSIFAFD